MEGENNHRTPPQGSIAMVGESRNDNEIVNSNFDTPYDEIDSPADNAVDEREEGPESFRTEHEMSDSQNEDEEETENDGASVPLAFAQASEYCILCRARLFPFYFINEPNLRRYQEWLSENPAEQWQLNIRAGMKLRLDHESPVMTKVFMFDSRAVETSLIGQPASKIIHLDPRPDLDDPIDTFAYCFHDWCYSVLSWKTKQNSAKFLFELGRNLNTSTVWEKPAEWNGPLYPQIDSNAILSTADDEFARLQPLFLSRLPVELRSRIWSYVGSEAAYSAFLLVVGEISHLARQISRPTEDLLAIEPNSYIRAVFNEVYGTEYIRDLSQDSTSSGGIKILETVIEIDIVSSVHGICAVRFLGSSWTSEWLGRIPQTGHSWYGTIQVETNLLMYSHNGLCVSEIDDLSVSNRVQVLWDQPHHPPPTFDADAALFAMHEPEQLYRKELPELAFFRFISLTCRGEYISGLTMYFLSQCIVGIESHFSSGSYFVGSRGEVAVHMSLASGEVISDVWLRLYMGCPVESVPAVSIQTTLGRECTFGPYVTPDNYGQYIWAKLRHEGLISGFYYENAPGIKRIGVIGDNRKVSRAETQLPRYETRVPEQPYLGNPQFVTDAIIGSLETVNICRVGRRCVGILIKYLDPEMPPVALGQWYDKKNSQHTCIYDNTKTSSTVIVFKRSKLGGMVQDILFSNPDSPELKESCSDVEMKIFELETRIVWWFTGKNDSITAWRDGHDMPFSIPAESALIQTFD
ncbi:hypothetical protein EAE96_005551 [Botrytis aclada]|nr:hypothetical protein EAE96_005551 [Botrytis aclada]